MRLIYDITLRTLSVRDELFKTTENEPLTVELKKNNVAYVLVTGETLKLIILPKGVSDTAKLVEQEIAPGDYDEELKLYKLTFSAYTQPALDLLGIGDTTELNDSVDSRAVELVLVYRPVSPEKPEESYTVEAKLARSLDLPTSSAPGVVPAYSIALADDPSYFEIFANGGSLGRVLRIVP